MGTYRIKLVLRNCDVLRKTSNKRLKILEMKLLRTDMIASSRALNGSVANVGMNLAINTECMHTDHRSAMVMIFISFRYQSRANIDL